MDLVDFTKFLVTSIIKENENILVEWRGKIERDLWKT